MMVMILSYLLRMLTHTVVVTVHTPWNKEPKQLHHYAAQNQQQKCCDATMSIRTLRKRLIPVGSLFKPKMRSWFQCKQLKLRRFRSRFGFHVTDNDDLLDHVPYVATRSCRAELTYMASSLSSIFLNRKKMKDVETPQKNQQETSDRNPS